MSENKRTETAREHDDSELIEAAEPATGQSGVAGGNLQRKIAARAEEHQLDTGDDQGVESVRGHDKPDKGDLPNLPNRD